MKHVKRIVLVFLFLSVTWCGAAENPFNVDCFLGWGSGSYRPGQWTPLGIGITSTLTEPFEGQVIVSVAQDSTNRMDIRQPFVLTPGLPVNMPLVTKIASGADKLNLRLVNAKGRTCYEQEIHLWDYTDRNTVRLKPVKQEDLFVGVVGRSQQFGLLALTKEIQCNYRNNMHNNQNRPPMGKVVVESELPRMVPWDWTGFSALDLLVLYDPDWSRFKPEQIQGITEWVLQGGRLVMILGANGLPSNALIDQLSIRVGTLQEKTVTRDWLGQWGLADSQEAMAVVYPVSPRSKTVLTKDTDALFAMEHMGFGRVAVLGLDPGVLGEHQRAFSTDFWLHLLEQMFSKTDTDLSGVNSRRRINRASLSSVVGHAVTQESREFGKVVARDDEDQRNRNYFNYTYGVEQQSTGRILDYLYGIDEMRPLSIGWVVLLLVLLAILLGPVDYGVLKRLDKLPLTWVTSLGWIVLFTVGAYYGVQALRAGDMQLRTVSLVDAVQDQGPAWTTRVCGLFAPKSDEYQFNQLAPGQWFSGVAASGGNRYGPQGHSANRTLYCRQINGSNLPYAVPINIWTMQTLLAESHADLVPIRAQVKAQGDSFVVEITNQGDSVIVEGMVLFASGRGFRVPRVEPGKTCTMEGAVKPVGGWTHRSSQMRRNRRSLDPADVFTLVGTKGRSRGIQDYLDQGAAVVCVQFENEPSPFTVKNKGACKYDHIQFARLVVFPQ